MTSPFALALRVTGRRSWTSAGVAMLLSMLFPRALKCALVTFQSLAAILGKDGFVLWAFWPFVHVGTALEAISLEPELRLGAR